MRSIAIPALLLSALAGLAVVPTASAAPPQSPCNGFVHIDETVGPVHASITPGMCYEFTVDPMSCPLGPKEETRRDLTVNGARYTLIVYTCGSPEPEASASAPPCTCPPPPQCTPATTTGPITQVVRIDLTSDCRVIIQVLPMVACSVEPIDGRRSVTQGRVTLVLPCGQIDPCEPPMECYPTAAPMAADPLVDVCGHPDMCNDAGCPYPVGAGRGTNLEVADQTVTYPCGPQDLCSGPMRCTSPFGSAAVMIPPVCIERTIDQGALEGHVGQCGPQYVGVVDCSGGGAQGLHADSRDVPELAKVSPLAYVLIDYCLPHSPPPVVAAASNPSPCGSSASMGARCPAPVPLCSGLSGPVAVGAPLALSAQAAPVNASYRIHDNCRVSVWVKADVMDCLWGEGYNPSTYGPVTLWTWGCRPPPVYEAMMADPFPTCIRECSPVPDVACDLQAATPGDLPFTTLDGRALVWGSDCDIDVETMCLGGSSSSTDVRALFLDVSLARCSGPAWS